MSVTLINLSGFTWAITSAETGINCAKISLEVEPEINEWVPNIDGQARGKVVGDPMGKMTMEGETSSTNSGIMAATFISAFVPQNSVAFFGRTQGGFYADRFNLERERGILQKVTAEFSSRFNVA